MEEPSLSFGFGPPVSIKKILVSRVKGQGHVSTKVLFPTNPNRAFDYYHPPFSHLGREDRRVRETDSGSASHSHLIGLRERVRFIYVHQSVNWSLLTDVRIQLLPL